MQQDSMNSGEGNASEIELVFYDKWTASERKMQRYPLDMLIFRDGPLLYHGILYCQTNSGTIRYLEQQKRWVEAVIRFPGRNDDDPRYKVRVSLDELTDEQLQAFIEVRLRLQ